MAVMQTMKVLKSMEKDEILEVHSDDVAFEANIRSMCSNTGHILFSLENKVTYWEAIIKKGT